MGEHELTVGSTNLDVFARTLIDVAAADKDVVVVTSDSRGSGRIAPFAEKYPDRILEMGIAEQNVIGVSAGLAAAGKKVFVVSPACFVTARAFEQIKNDIAYSDRPVKVIGISAGVSYGSLGTTHHSTYDFAALQAVHNIDIVAPADNFETDRAIRAAVNHPRPIYLRFGKKPMPHLHTPDTAFEIGRGIFLAQPLDRCDIGFIATGEAVAPALLASRTLEKLGKKCAVLSLHSIRPFDEAAVKRIAEQARVLLTVEEHSVFGGLGSRVATFLAQSGHSPLIKIIGIPDEHMITGTQSEIFQYYGISSVALENTALELLKRVSA